MGELSNVRASLNIVKGCVGLGVLCLPRSTSYVGWLISSIGMAIVGYITTQGIFYSVMAKQRLDEADDPGGGASDARDYGAASAPATAEKGGTGLGLLDGVVERTLGTAAQAVCAVCIVLVQFGTCVSYLTTIITNVLVFAPGESARIWALVALGLLLTAVALFRTLKDVAVLSAVGMSIFVFILAFLLSETAREIGDGTFGAGAPMVQTEQVSYSKWFGPTSFAFGVLPVAVVVYEEMAEPEHFFSVCGWSMVGVWAFYTVVAVLGFLCYGSQVESLIYLSYPEGSFIRNGSAIAISLVLFFTYTLQMMPLYKSMEHFFPMLHYGVARASLVILSILVAFLVPSTDVILEWTGVFASSLSGFILPALAYLKVSRSTLNIREAISASAVLCVGFCAMGDGVFEQILKIVNPQPSASLLGISYVQSVYDLLTKP